MGCHITEVRFTDRTIENFNAVLHQINRELPIAQQRTNVELWQKLLQSIASAGNMELQTIVRNELQDQSKVHPAGHALAGQPNLPEYVLYFSERWRSLLRDGIIKPMAPRKRAPPSGNRVDAMLTSPTATPPVLSASTTFSSSFTTPSSATERICWNCKGLGHMRNDENGKVICPSPVRPRSYQHCIAALEIARRRDMNRPSSRRRMFVRRSRSASARLAGVAEEYDVVEIDDTTQTVYDADGICLGLLSEFSAKPVNEPEGNASEQTPRSVESPSEMLNTDISEQATVSSDTGPPGSTAALTPFNPAEFAVDDDFSTPFIHLASVDESPAVESSPEQVLADATVPSRTRRVVMLSAAALLSAAAMQSPHRTSSRGFILLSLACAASASQLPSEQPVHLQALISPFSARSSDNPSLSGFDI